MGRQLRARMYLQDVVQQGNAALVGLGLCEFQQRVNLEAHGVARVTSLRKKKNTPMSNTQDFSEK